jgi:hypothetical protein
MPFFSVDQQSGTFGLNSEGSVANAKLQQLLVDRDRPRKAITPEYKIQAERQKAVDAYYEGERTGDKVRLGTERYTLPMVAGPLPILIGQDNASAAETKAQRAEQFKGFQGNFLKTFGRGVYEEIDQAMAVVEKRKTQVLEKKQSSFKSKLFQSAVSKGKNPEWTTKESKYIFEPLHEAIQYLNKYHADEQIPLQIRWRQVWETEERKVEDVYMIFPNIASEAKKPMSSWKGMYNAIDKDVFL